MSGPKTSHYTLTPEQRRILAEQRMIRAQREMMAKQQQDTRSIVVQADRIIEKMEPLWKEINGDSSVLDQAKTMRAEAMETINRASQMNDQSGLAALQEATNKLREISGKLELLTRSLKKEHSAADKAFRTEMADRISEGFDVFFDNLGSSDRLNGDIYCRKIQDELAGIASLTISDAQQARAKVIRAKAAEIDDIGFLKNFYAMTVVPFVKECHAYHAAYTAQGEEYQRKRMIYEANTQLLGVPAEEIPFSDHAIALLDAKIYETEAAIQFREEQAYISRCVDEAMQEMGYSVLGNREIVKRNGKKFRNELYLFDEGTAVNVTYSSDGQITMELGGISTDDRIPSGEECTSLASDMRTFCDDYCEIERRLRQKGIVAKRISILPPDAQYAQIINVSDYNLCVAVSEYEAKKEKKQTTNAQTRRLGE